MEGRPTDSVFTYEENLIFRMLLRKFTEKYHVKLASDLGYALYNLGHTEGVKKN